MSRQFVIIPARAFFNAELSPMDIQVLGALGYHADENGLCWPSVRTIAALIGCGRSSVSRSIQNLEDRQIIEVNRNNSGYQNQYRIIMDRDETGGVVHREPTEEGVSHQRDRVSHTSMGHNETNNNSTHYVRTIKARATARDELSTVLDDEHVQAVIDHRQAKKAKLTPRAAKLLANEFAKCRDPNAAADEMIARGWQGFKIAWLDSDRGKPVRKGLSWSEYARVLMEEGDSNEPDSEIFDGNSNARSRTGEGDEVSDRLDAVRSEAGGDAFEVVGAGRTRPPGKAR